jgi:uncharacterized protein involved in tolerance to divalent cations
MSDDEIVEVTTTCATRDDVLRIAQALIDERLAACVQLGGPITSVYRWQGRTETSQEWRCTAKTLRTHFPRIAQRIGELHPYELPEILAVPVVEASEKYRAWVIAEVSA